MKNVICIGGLPGSGKTQLGDHLKKRYGFSTFDDWELTRMYLENSDTILQQLRYHIQNDPNGRILICNPLITRDNRRKILTEIFQRLNIPAFLIYISESLEELIKIALFRRTIIHIEGVKTSPEDLEKCFRVQEMPQHQEGWQHIRMTTQNEIKKLMSNGEISRLLPIEI